MHLVKFRIDSERYPTRRFYPFNVPVLSAPTEVALRSPVTFFVGENGSGKSTLLEALTRCCGIHIWDRPRRHVAHHNPYEGRLADCISVTWADGRVPGTLFRAETFHDFADFIDDVALCDPGRLRYQGGQILNTLSHGEAILSYFSNRYQARGLYFLDEPEAAFSPARQIEFLNLLQRLAAQGHAQFIIVTHSPLLLALPGAQILSFDGARIRTLDYEETAHYQLYKQFFTDRTALLGTPDAAVSFNRQNGRHQSLSTSMNKGGNP